MYDICFLRSIAARILYQINVKPRSAMGLPVEFASNNILGLANDIQGAMKFISSFGSADDSKINARSVCLKINSSSIERSLCLKNWEAEKTVLETTAQPRNHTICSSELVSPKPQSELDAAATKLQKVYKSYRTRRNLADCAVVVEELWWKALDFASLKRSSVSFFNGEKPETALSRWARARTKAAKVGKGLSKSDDAQKLALQHWLEAIDPRHRYGHNLHLYYDVWTKSESTQPFFYWMDIGDGKEMNLDECPRTTLQNQSIKYLGPNERKAYEVILENGRLVYKQSHSLVNTDEVSKWIFVLGTLSTLYVGKKKKGKFQHSSFLAGGAIKAAGRLVAKEGILKAIWPYSGHYLPTEENFKAFIYFLEDNNVDLTYVKRCSIDEDEYPSFKRQKYEAEKNVQKGAEAEEVLQVSSDTEEEEAGKEPRKLATLKLEVNLDESAFPDDERLPCNWTTGAGPRIGCVRDYPTDLQCKALEQVNLSTRIDSAAAGCKDPIFSPRPNPGVMLSPRLSDLMGIPSTKPPLHFSTR